ncbi:hypothetical protein N0V88_006356 [Collariella sp. IMI 366227]|nr:hypothetical protein N0V88_006356 [Collariella sp. IMI 366227]
MAAIFRLPVELVISILAALPEMKDLAAAALANRSLYSLANPILYTEAAAETRTAKLALFYAVENGLVGPARLLLERGANPNLVFCSPIARDSLHRLLEAQGCRYGRQPLVDRTLALECLNAWALPDVRRSNDLLLATLFSEANNTSGAEDDVLYDSLVRDMQALVTQAGRYVFSDLAELETHPEYGSRCYQWTALHIAALRGHDELVTLLLNSGAAINPLLRDVVTPTSCNVVQGLFASAPPSMPKETPLHLAISAGHDFTAQLLLTRGALVTVGSGGETALHVAAWHGNLELCRFLVEKAGISVHVQTSACLTPFHYAVASGHLPTVGRFLLERGADIRGRFQGHVLTRITTGSWTCNAFIHALRTKRFLDALLLLDIDSGLGVPDPDDISPLLACFRSHDLDHHDEEQLVPVLRRLFSDGQILSVELVSALESASEKCLPQATKMILEYADDEELPDHAVWFCLDLALWNARTSAGVDVVVALLDYALLRRQMPLPGLRHVFQEFHPRNDDANGYHGHSNDLGLEDPEVLDVKLGIARLLHKRHAASSQGVDELDLLDTLLGACRPGGRKVCEWLAGLGALRHVDRHRFVVMLQRVAQYWELGGQSPDVADWLLTQAATKGVLDHILKEFNVRSILLAYWRHCEVAAVVVRHNTMLNPHHVLENAGPCPQYPESRIIFSSHTRARLPTRPVRQWTRQLVFTMACGSPENPGAAELAQLVLEGLGDRARDEFVNCALQIPNTHGCLFTIASIVCSPQLYRPRTDQPPSEPARLAILNLLLAAGAEIHTLIHYHPPPPSLETPPSASRNQAKPSGMRSPSNSLSIRNLQHPSPSTPSLDPFPGKPTPFAAPSQAACRLSCAPCSRPGPSPTQTTPLR